MSSPQNDAQTIIDCFAAVTYYAHPHYSISLSHQAVRALHFLSRHPAARIDDVAMYLACAPNTASEIVRRLAEKDLIIRRRSLHDERVVHAHLTELGNQILEENTGLAREKLIACLAALPPQQREQITQGITLLAQALEKMKED